MKSEIQNPKSKIAVVGAGPAGASLAIRLAKKNFDVVLIEREKFPRHKLCGEFISPECLRHFRAIGVFGEMLAAGGASIEKTVFYAPDGKSVAVPSKWFGAGGQSALSLSRAAMDFRLLEKAKQTGVAVLEDAQVVGLLQENGKVSGVKVRTKDGSSSEFFADLIVDATGRANVLGKLAEKTFLTQREINSKSTEIKNRKLKIENRLVGFKTHLENAAPEKGACEIYFFRGGYGGLSAVENGAANLCFLIRAETVKEFGGDAEKIVREIVFRNKRAAKTLQNAKSATDWLAVSVDGFGAKVLNPAPNLFAVGDAAAFIDPFTGSGMLMALESAEIFADILAENRFAPALIAEKYKLAHREKFQKRLRVCSLMRRAAFVPELAGFLISALGLSRRAREILARSTRQSVPANENER